MNKHESDILELLLKDSKLTQRRFSERCQKFLEIIKKATTESIVAFFISKLVFSLEASSKLSLALRLLAQALMLQLEKECCSS